MDPQNAPQQPPDHHPKIMPRYYEADGPRKIAIGDELCTRVPGDDFLAKLMNVCFVHVGIYVGNGKIISKYFNPKTGRGKLKEETLPVEGQIENPKNRWNGYAISRKGHWYASERAKAAYKSYERDPTNCPLADYEYLFNDCRVFTNYCLQLTNEQILRIYAGEMDRSDFEYGYEFKTMKGGVVLFENSEISPLFLGSHIFRTSIEEEGEFYYPTAAPEHLPDHLNTLELNRVVELHRSQASALELQDSKISRSWNFFKCDESERVEVTEWLANKTLTMSIPLDSKLPFDMKQYAKFPDHFKTCTVTDGNRDIPTEHPDAPVVHLPEYQPGVFVPGRTVVFGCFDDDAQGGE